MGLRYRVGDPSPEGGTNGQSYKWIVHNQVNRERANGDCGFIITRVSVDDLIFMGPSYTTT